MSVPGWVQDAIFYQIFPDRFANGDPDNDPPNLQPWGAEPTVSGFQGGDLRGIIQRFDYLLDLGINALYLNPIFQASSNHRYNTFDYYQIDPRLGRAEDFDALIALAHRHGVRVVLDGVFNHCGRGFFAFADVLENGESSPYRDWFHIHHFPLDAFTPGEARSYSGWWNFKSLPKFNTGNRQVRDYLFRVARHWIERGADGWRLDVPNEIDDDDFWAEFRSVVKSVNRDAYLVGEIWTPDSRWANDAHFDGLMNYPLREALLARLNGEETGEKLGERLDMLLKEYPRENLFAMYLPLGTHDTARLSTLLNGDMARIKLAFLLQFAFPGAPAIYYGDEVGLEGGKDPDCRRAFPWDAAQWKGDLQPWVRQLVAQRKARPSLRRGDFLKLDVHAAHDVYAFARTHADQHTLAVFNFGPSRAAARIDVGSLSLADGAVHGILDGADYTIKDGRLAVELEAWSGAWIAGSA